MDAGELQARITQMREAAVTLGRSATRIQECIDSVDTEVRAIGTDRFMSIGAEAFRAEYNRLTPQLKDAFTSLVNFKDKLNISADDIEAAARTKS